MQDVYWIASSKGKRYERLQKDLQTDYLIIGGGFPGLTAFYLMTKAGLKVCLIDADRIAYGVSGRNTGKVTAQHGLIYNTLENKFGLDRAKQYYTVNQKAVEFVENMITQHHIDCDFTRIPACVFTQDEGYMTQLEKEYETYQRIGIDSGLSDETGLPFKVLKALYMHNQSQLHPKKYLDAMAEKGVEQGGVIYEDTRVVDFQPGETCTIKTGEGHVIKAGTVLITSHFPCYDGLGFYMAKLHPKRTYAVMAPYKGDFPKCHFINAESPTRSLRYVYEADSLLIVGESHKVGHQKEDYYEELKVFGTEVFGLKDYPYEWSAQDYMPPHGIPFIGNLKKDMKNVFVATGFKKWGLSTGTAAGIILHNMITQGESPYEALYHHSTLSDIASREFIIENADVAFQLVTGKLKLGDTELPEEAGEARVVNVNGLRCGYYRDENDEVYLLDVTCTHMGCELKWNALDKSWDCPCHGSRFDYKGNVLEGPAELRLKNFERKKNKLNPQII